METIQYTDEQLKVAGEFMGKPVSNDEWYALRMEAINYFLAKGEAYCRARPDPTGRLKESWDILFPAND